MTERDSIVVAVIASLLVTRRLVAPMRRLMRAARAVGTALAALSGASLNTVPWQRVIGASGRCTHRDGFSASVQRDLLEREGVRFDRRGHVDLKRVRWAGPRREWVTRLRTEL